MINKSFIKKLLLALLFVCAFANFTGCNQEDPANPCKGTMYCTQDIATSFANVAPSNYLDILGAKVIDSGINFAVYSEHAERIELLLFNNPESSVPTKRLPMTYHPESHIWTLYVEGVGVGQHYGYIAWGPNWTYDESFTPGSSIGFKSDCDVDGNRFNPNKLLLDPYTLRIHRDFDWGAGNPASGTARNVSDWQAAAKSVVIQSEYKWSEHESEWRNNRMKGDSFTGHAANDLILYEVQPKAFTQKALNVANPGTWKGIGENAEYLKDLGITAVELMPVMEKPDDGTYWGYNTIAFFAPEQRYATEIAQSKPNGVHDEFKEMVDKLHQAGIEVILDVVYNHTGEGGFWRSKIAQNDFDYGAHANFDDPTAATIYNFCGLDNKAYYHLVSDASGTPHQSYLDETGVGNQMRTNVQPFRRLIVDNLRFWVEEMHVDGFRFDLASILGVDDAKVSTHGDAMQYDNDYWAKNIGNTVIQDIIDDEVLAKYNTRLIAEPWSLGQYAIGLFPKSEKKENFAWSEWNGKFRDMMRSFVNDDHYNFSSKDGNMEIGNLLLGSSTLFGDDGRKPYHSINFITAHDGFTLYDLETYWEKHNGCGKLNPICCSDRYNAFCDLDSGEAHNRSRNWCVSHTCQDNGNQYSCPNDDWLTSSGKCENTADEAIKRQMIRNFFTLLMTAHGSPMILGGDEYMRTQFGNNNAYSDSADNEYNWFRWGDWLQWNEHIRMHDFVRQIIKLRKQFKAHLAPAEYKAPLWWGPEGHSEDYWGGKSLGMYYQTDENTPALFVLINMETYEDRTFSLPESGTWKILLDTQMYFDHDIFSQDATLDSKKSQNIWLDGSKTTSEPYTLKPRSIVILSK